MSSLLRRVRRVVTSHMRGFMDSPLPYRGGQQEEEVLFSTDESPDDPCVSSSDSPDPVMDQKEAEYRANLEVGPHASMSEIRVAYKRLMKVYHPDLHAMDVSKREVAEPITQRLNEAMNYFEKKS